jgi:hypothetical protein
MSRAIDASATLAKLAQLRPAAARTVINDLRNNTVPNEALADGLVAYYSGLPVKARFIATNVIQAICYHGTHRHFYFMLRAISALIQEPPGQHVWYALASAVNSAGYLGLPEDCNALLNAGTPWPLCPVLELARALTFMIVKRDGLWTKDLDSDYVHRIRSYEGPYGGGLDGFIAEANGCLAPAVFAKSECKQAVAQEITARLGDLGECCLIAFSWSPKYIAGNSPLDKEFKQKLADTPAMKFCGVCGSRMRDVTAYVYGKSGVCPRCLFLALREWLIEDQGLSPDLWRLPPQNSPVSHEKAKTGPSFVGQWHPATVEAYDQHLQRAYDFGPTTGFWHGLMMFGGLADEIMINRTGSAVRISCKLNRCDSKAVLTPEMLFTLWRGEVGLLHERDTTWAGEHACTQIVADLIGEPALRQWTADWLVNPMTKANLYVDAFFPSHNLAVEHQGLQHYEPVDFFGGRDAFEDNRRRDEIKALLLKQHGIALLAVRYDQVNRRSIAQLLQAVK